jgi:hypothetical protein
VRMLWERGLDPSRYAVFWNRWIEC